MQRQYIKLYKSLSPQQLVQVENSGWRRFAADGSKQRVFYPKVYLSYAEQIARQWDAVQFERGFVVSFKICAEVLHRYEIQTVAYEEHLEYRVPIAELEFFNQQIMGKIELVSSFCSESASTWLPAVNAKAVATV